MMKSRYRWRCRRVCGDHGGAALRRGMPKIEGWIFDTPGAICPCVLDARVRDSRRASRRGRAARGGWYDCVDHASSRRAPGCASCQKGLRRSHDRFCPHCVRPVHARPRQTAGAAAREGRTAVDTENGRLSVRQSDWAAWARSSNDESIGNSIACDAPAAGNSFIHTRCVASPNRSTACQPSVFCRNSPGDSPVRSRAIG